MSMGTIMGGPSASAMVTELLTQDTKYPRFKFDQFRIDVWSVSMVTETAGTGCHQNTDEQTHKELNDTTVQADHKVIDRHKEDRNHHKYG